MMITAKRKSDRAENEDDDGCVKKINMEMKKGRM